MPTKRNNKGQFVKKGRSKRNAPKRRRKSPARRRAPARRRTPARRAPTRRRRTSRRNPIKGQDVIMQAAIVGVVSALADYGVRTFVAPTMPTAVAYAGPVVKGVAGYLLTQQGTKYKAAGIGLMAIAAAEAATGIVAMATAPAAIVPPVKTDGASEAWARIRGDFPRGSTNHPAALVNSLERQAQMGRPWDAPMYSRPGRNLAPRM